MNALLSYQFEEQPVRVVMIADEPWFVANDVAKVLGYKLAPHMVRMLDDDEKGIHIVDTPGGQQEMNIISEDGLYGAIWGSRKPEAKRFRKWVKEVLRTIRKTGKYELPGHEPPPALPSPRDYDATFLSAAAGLIREGRRLFGPIGARSVWLQLGLPQPVVDAESGQLGDPWAAPVHEWLAGRVETTASEIAEGVGIAPLDFQARRRIRALLDLFGWREGNLRRNGEQVKRWVAPAQAREA